MKVCSCTNSGRSRDNYARGYHFTERQPGEHPTGHCNQRYASITKKPVNKETQKSQRTHSLHLPPTLTPIEPHAHQLGRRTRATQKIRMKRKSVLTNMPAGQRPTMQAPRGVATGPRHTAACVTSRRQRVGKSRKSVLLSTWALRGDVGGAGCR